jgi:uncharacterized membrane protein YdjX (TVP38/TMEM64 family)
VRRALPFVLLLILVAAFIAGLAARQQAGLEVSVESVQSWVAGMGWRGPAIYVGLVTFRFFLLMPSWVVLLAGGLVFGTLLGTALGGAGIVISAVAGFAVARGIGREWVRPYLAERYPTFQQSVERAGPLVVGIVTAHPVGPMSPLHLAAGLSAVPILGFLVAVLVGGPLRAFLLSLFGSTLVDPQSWQFLVATSLLIVMALLPLANRRLRQRILGLRAPDGDSAGETSPE